MVMHFFFLTSDNSLSISTSSLPSHVPIPPLLLSALIFIKLLLVSLPLCSSWFELHSFAAAAAAAASSPAAASPFQKGRLGHFALPQTPGANTLRASALQPLAPYSAYQPSLTQSAPPDPAVLQERAGKVQAECTAEQGEMAQAWTLACCTQMNKLVSSNAEQTS